LTKNKYYLTTAIPYVNARPHIGHALEYVIADAIKRYHELRGNDVYIASGADENALKNVQAAEKESIPIQKFLDSNSKIFENFYKTLGVNLNSFRRGSDEKNHWPGVTKLWKKVEKNNDLYKKKYKGLYCTGCESFKTEKDLVDGNCPDHDRPPEEVEEENYFFALSKYQDRLLKLIETDEYLIIPQKRKNEVLSFIKDGLEDFSVSRSEKRSKGVGVPVPGDAHQKIYVWFDALTIYMTAVGFGQNEKLWKKWWPADLHIVGKDIIRFHAVYWPAMLMSAGLPLPKTLLVHGFIDSGGRKMSKTLGNTIDPYEIIDKYGVEALRYFLLSQIPTLDDGNFTKERFKEVYTADLANGLGNLVARTIQLANTHLEKGKRPKAREFPNEYTKAIDSFQLNQALVYVWEKVRALDQELTEKEPFNLIKKAPKKAKEIIFNATQELYLIGRLLNPFLPETSSKIKEAVISNKKPESLFPRLT